MNCIVHFDDVRVSGGFSFNITNSEWTSEDIVRVIKEGAATIPNMIDGAPIFHDGLIIAKISKALPKFDFGVTNLTFEKNLNIPYFFGFEDRDDVLSQFHELDGFFQDKEILLAAKHVEGNDGYGNLLIILKSGDNRYYYTHIEDTIRTRNGPNKFYSDCISRINLQDKRYLSNNLHFAKEYQEVINKILTQANLV